MGTPPSSTAVEPNAEPAAEAPEPEAVSVIAWENGGGPDLLALRRTVWDGLSRPVSYSERIPWVARDLYHPLVFAVLCATVGHLARVGQRLFSTATVTLPAYPGLTSETQIPHVVEGLLTAPLFPLMFTVLLFASAFLTHLVLDLVGAAKRPFEATFRVVAYAHVGKVLLVLPILGASVQVCYLVFLVLTGLRAAHGAGLAISALALLPVIIADLMLGMT